MGVLGRLRQRRPRGDRRFDGRVRWVVPWRRRRTTIRRYVNGVWSGYQPLGGGLQLIAVGGVGDEAGTSRHPGYPRLRHRPRRACALHRSSHERHLLRMAEPRRGSRPSDPTAGRGTDGSRRRRGGWRRRCVHVASRRGRVAAVPAALGGLRPRSGTWLVSHPSGTYVFHHRWRPQHLLAKSSTAGTGRHSAAPRRLPPVAVRDGVGISYFIRGLRRWRVNAVSWNGTNWAPYENLGGYSSVGGDCGRRHRRNVGLRGRR